MTAHVHTSGSLVASGRCTCVAPHVPKLVAVTGGPGAGKTAVLEVARRHYCEHVVVLPEAASIVYGGGFPRLEGPSARRHAQIAIMHVQDQMEQIELEASNAALVLCDRGVLDGLAYWPDDAASYFRELGRTQEELLARYAAVLHLRPPSESDGYDHQNPLRIESARQAAAIDRRIEQAYALHPHRAVIASASSFVSKLEAALSFIDACLPPCCREPHVAMTGARSHGA